MRYDQLTIDEMMMLKAEPFAKSSDYQPPGADVGQNLALMAHLCADYIGGLRTINQQVAKDSEIASLIDQIQNKFQRCLPHSISELMTQPGSKTDAVSALSAKLAQIAKDSDDLDRASVRAAMADICSTHNCTVDQLRSLFIAKHSLGPTDWAIKMHRSLHENDQFIPLAGDVIMLEATGDAVVLEVLKVSEDTIWCEGVIGKYDRDELAQGRIDEAKYHGREVKLGKPMKGDVKKYKVYVRDPKTGNIKKVSFGDTGMEIKRDDPKRRKNFRARHGCGTSRASDRTKARYWSCRMWSTKSVGDILKGK